MITIEFLQFLFINLIEFVYLNKVQRELHAAKN
jgi:hypothetical protein